jgi:hypothetical protein
VIDDLSLGALMRKNVLIRRATALAVLLTSFLPSYNVQAQNAARDFLEDLVRKERKAGNMELVDYYVGLMDDVYGEAPQKTIDSVSKDVIAKPPESDSKVDNPSKKPSSVETQKAVSVSAPQRKASVLPQLKRKVMRLDQPAKEDALTVDEINLDKYEETAFPLPLKLPPGHSILVKASAVKRMLSINPEKVMVERVDDSSANLIFKDYGKSTVHLWTDKGRRTLIVASMIQLPPQRIEYLWSESKSMRFRYATNWNGHYKGDDIGSQERTSYSFSQTLSANGPVPIGDFDATLNWRRRNQNDELTNARMGITNGQLGFLEDFKLRLYDVGRSFSTYTLPGASLKGVLFETPVADGLFDYSYLYGQERDTVYGNLDPGLNGDRDVYNQAVRVGYHPDANTNFYFNAAEGWGEDRSELLRERAFAVESEHRFENVLVRTEVGTDETHVAAKIDSWFNWEQGSLSLSAYNVDQDFSTVTGYAANEGRYGLNAGYSMRLRDSDSIRSNFSLYRDRGDVNEKDDHYPNFNFNIDYYRNLTESSFLGFDVDYTNKRGISSPYRRIAGGVRYNKSFVAPFDVLRRVSTYCGYRVSRSNYILSQSTNMLAHSVTLGLSTLLFSKVSWYVNADHNWEEKLEGGENTQSQRFATGLSFNQRITDKLSLLTSVRYDSSDQESDAYIGLSGEDAYEVDAEINYRPTRDVDVYLNGSLRRTDPEDRPSNYDPYEASLGFGASISWDSFICWARPSIVSGYVFRDENADGIFTDGEPVLQDARLIMGPYETHTNADGYYQFKVRAIKAELAIDRDSVPYGLAFTTKDQLVVSMNEPGQYRIDFGVSINSGINGVVFHDINGNGKLDRADLPMQGVRVVLAGTSRGATTNSSGMYFFNNLEAGVYNLMLDLQSLPIEYLPASKLKNEIEVIEGVTYKHFIPVIKQEK